MRNKVMRVKARCHFVTGTNYLKVRGKSDSDRSAFTLKKRQKPRGKEYPRQTLNCVVCGVPVYLDRMEKHKRRVHPGVPQSASPKQPLSATAVTELTRSGSGSGSGAASRDIVIDAPKRKNLEGSS
jgi:hypothetical protein